MLKQSKRFRALSEKVKSDDPIPLVDAIRQFGVNDIDMPATPMRVWTAIQGGPSDAGGPGSESGGGLGSIDATGGDQ